MINKFIEIQNYSELEKMKLEQIFKFIIARANGEVPTGANFIRNYIVNHPLYKHDSIVSSSLASNLTL